MNKEIIFLIIMYLYIASITWIVIDADYIPLPAKLIALTWLSIYYILFYIAYKGLECSPSKNS